jgi:exopolysaccharide biosynthesis WecB/TagA/CpsF family protein
VSHDKTAHPRGFRIARAIDLAVACFATVLLGPVLAIRAVAGRITSGRWFDATPALGIDCRVISLLDFAGQGRGRRMARLFNLLRGDLALGGPRPARIGDRARWMNSVPERFSVRPGLVGTLAPSELTGVVRGSAAEADREFCAGYGALSGTKLAIRWLVARCIAGPARSGVAPSLEILGLTLANTTMDDAVAWMVGRARARRRTLVAFANPDCINIAQDNLPYRRVLQRADRVFADGIGIRIAARLLGHKMADNVNGTDLFPQLCGAAARNGLKVFMLGARPGLAEKGAAAMCERFPNLSIAGTRHGYFEPAETDKVIAEINGSGADILLVAMGAPQQELWLARHADELTVPVRLGVGGLFDFYSGRIPRAPAWMREAGFEWAWRLRCEPGRLWKRYLVGNPVFLARVMHQRALGRHGRAAHALQVGNPASRTYAGWRTSLRMRMPAIRDRAMAFGKRSLDILASGSAIVALSPVFGLVALAIRMESPGSVIFRQKRVGRDGETFMMLKFRSMYVDAEARKAALMANNEMAGGVIFKMKNDPRVTRVGSFIRRTSIDELPQLFNVLRGDMSLVGPRPPLPSEVAEYTLKDRGRLDAAPGITCIWQVSGRSEIPFKQQVEMDLDYIHQQSLGEDVKLLLKTVPALVKGRGAY